jgi:hypothetical protein
VAITAETGSSERLQARNGLVVKWDKGCRQGCRPGGCGRPLEAYARTGTGREGVSKWGLNSCRKRCSKNDDRGKFENFFLFAVTFLRQ